MGWHPHAHAVIGVYLTKKECFGDQEIVKAFNHDQEFDINVQYDSKTGRELWKFHTPCLFNSEYEDNGIHEVITPDGIQSIADGERDASHLYLGIIASANEKQWRDPGQGINLSQASTVLHTQLQTFLTPLMLWDLVKDRFGLYAVLS